MDFLVQIHVCLVKVLLVELRNSTKFDTFKFQDKNPLITIMQNFEEKIIMDSLPLV